MIRLKGNVICPKVLIILAATVNAHTELKLESDVVVTSANDSQHMQGSRHYRDEALDFRVHGLSSKQMRDWRDVIARRLGSGYRAILESEGTSNAHLHIEVD